MIGEQLVLIEDVRLPEPECYGAVVDAMETVFGNQPEMEDWPSDRLASDIWQFAAIEPEPEYEDVERSVRIYRERNGLSVVAA